MRRIWAGLTLALVACGAPDGAGTTTTVEVTTSSSATSSSTSTETTTASPPASSPSSTTTPGDDPALPGEPVSLGPAAGDLLAVFGVAHDDVLNLRERPGADQAVLAEIPPLYITLTAQGATRHLPSSFWTLVDFDGIEGWVNLSYVAYHGAATDETARVFELLGADTTAGTIEALGVMVLEAVVTGDPEVVTSGVPTDEDPGLVVYDLVGLEDDSVAGGRLWVVGEPAGDVFRLVGVESIPFCSRGTDVEGRCV